MKEKYCSNLYFMTVKGTCQKYKNSNHVIFNYSNLSKRKLSLNHNAIETRQVAIKQFICNNGKAIDVMFLNDLIFDCGPDGDDEPILMSLLTIMTIIHHVCNQI